MTKARVSSIMVQWGPLWDCLFCAPGFVRLLRYDFAAMALNNEVKLKVFSISEAIPLIAPNTSDWEISVFSTKTKHPRSQKRFKEI